MGTGLVSLWSYYEWFLYFFLAFFFPRKQEWLVAHKEIIWISLALGILISGNRCGVSADRGVVGIRGTPMTLYMVDWAWCQDGSSEPDFLWLRRQCDVSSHLSSHRHLTIPSAEAVSRSFLAFELTFHSCCQSTKQAHDTGTLRPLVTLGFVKRCYICWCSKKTQNWHVFIWGWYKPLWNRGPFWKNL